MGSIEAGVLETFRQEGIKEPKTAVELLALGLAIRLDNLVDERNIAGLSRELRLTLEEVKNQPRQTDNFLDNLVNKQ